MNSKMRLGIQLTDKSLPSIHEALVLIPSAIESFSHLLLGEVHSVGRNIVPLMPLSFPCPVHTESLDAVVEKIFCSII